MPKLAVKEKFISGSANCEQTVNQLNSKSVIWPLIKVHDKSFETYLSEEIILEAYKELAEEINKDYAGKRPLFIAILNGSFMFASDLFKHLTIEAELCFIKLASYKGMKSSGNVVTSIGLEDDLFGKDVIIVEDIVDTGKTLHNFLAQTASPATQIIKDRYLAA